MKIIQMKRLLFVSNRFTSVYRYFIMRNISNMHPSQARNVMKLNSLLEAIF